MSEKPTANDNDPNARKADGRDYVSAIKWVAIAIVFVVIGGIAWKAYQIATAPVRIAQDMGSSISETTANVKAQADRVVNRLEVPVEKEKTFEQLSETAFVVLTEVAVTKPKSVSDRVFRSTNLRNSNDQVCEMSLDFGNGAIPVFAAANNKTYATAKDLGAKEDRIIRVHIVTTEDDLAVRAYWDVKTGQWAMRWRRATMGKPISDGVAQARLIDVLKAIPTECAGIPETGSETP